MGGSGQKTVKIIKKKRRQWVFQKLRKGKMEGITLSLLEHPH